MTAPHKSGLPRFHDPEEPLAAAARGPFAARGLVYGLLLSPVPAAGAAQEWIGSASKHEPANFAAVEQLG